MCACSPDSRGKTYCVSSALFGKLLDPLHKHSADAMPLELGQDAEAVHFYVAVGVADGYHLNRRDKTDYPAVNVGDILKADVFAEGDKVDVVGTSKGKGYQGVIKRFGQHRLRESHGTGPVARHAGSNGSTSSPSRVFKGKRLPGHMGAVRVTVQNLSIVKVDAENNLIAIKGAIPGPKGSVVTIHDSVKA